METDITGSLKRDGQGLQPGIRVVFIHPFCRMREKSKRLWKVSYRSLLLFPSFSSSCCFQPEDSQKVPLVILHISEEYVGRMLY